MSGTATATRRKRPTRCVVCLRRRRRPGRPTCATCAEREVCTRCEAPVAEIDGRKYRLCPHHLKIDRARAKPGQGSR